MKNLKNMKINYVKSTLLEMNIEDFCNVNGIKVLDNIDTSDLSKDEKLVLDNIYSRKEYKDICDYIVFTNACRNNNESLLNNCKKIDIDKKLEKDNFLDIAFTFCRIYKAHIKNNFQEDAKVYIK